MRQLVEEEAAKAAEEAGKEGKQGEKARKSKMEKSSLKSVRKERRMKRAMIVDKIIMTSSSALFRSRCWSGSSLRHIRSFLSILTPQDLDRLPITSPDEEKDTGSETQITTNNEDTSTNYRSSLIRMKISHYQNLISEENAKLEEARTAFTISDSSHIIQGRARQLRSHSSISSMSS